MMPGFPKKKQHPVPRYRRSILKRALLFRISCQKSLCNAFFLRFPTIRSPPPVSDRSFSSIEETVPFLIWITRSAIWCQCGVMRDDDHCHSLLPAHVLKQLQDCLTCLIIKCTCRLITEKKLRILCKSSCYRNTLLFTTGKLCREISHSVLQVRLLRGPVLHPEDFCRSAWQVLHFPALSDSAPDYKTGIQNRYHRGDMR